MDIHFINTTTGESMFVIFPDGTQMLIDAFCIGRVYDLIQLPHVSAHPDIGLD